MPRTLVLGNGSLLVCMDKYYQTRELYFPYVGQENHVQGHRHKIGVWVDGQFSWTFSGEWDIDINYKKETLVSSVTALNKRLNVKLQICDAVHYEKNVFLRKITIYNLGNRKREIRLFLNQHFNIAGANIGDTVYYDPNVNAVISYKGRRYFLISGGVDGKGFSEYATGVSGEHGKDGTWKDAEDGFLSKNPIEHGSVDSTIGFYFDCKGGGKKEVHYWIAVGKKYGDITELNKLVRGIGVERLINQTDEYWRKWVNKHIFNFQELDEGVVDLFKRSLLIIRTHTDNNGAIIAANDSDMLYSKKDTYSYMWPRDGALVARSLDKSGFNEITERFFGFCHDVGCKDGYLLHKYLPDRSLGSSWHPWIKKKKIQLPIQEDETALVLDALWKKYLQFESEEFAKGVYPCFIKKAGDFMVNFRDKKTKLPKESYDLWEEKLGVHTFTCATVYAGLKAAENFAKKFGTKKEVQKYRKSAEEVRKAILKYLYDAEENVFIKGIYYDEGNNMLKDKTVDVSTGYGIFEYKVLSVRDKRIERTVEQINQKLSVKTGIGGVARYYDDHYYRVSKDVPGNPWFVSTLWLAEYYISKARTKEDLEPAKKIFGWAVERALPSGVLSEQIHPYTGEPLSVSPLTWSHAGFVIAVVKYLDKLDELGICTGVCYPLKRKH